MGGFLMDRIGRKQTMTLGFFLWAALGFIIGGALGPIQTKFASSLFYTVSSTHWVRWDQVWLLFSVARSHSPPLYADTSWASLRPWEKLELLSAHR